MANAQTKRWEIRANIKFCARLNETENNTVKLIIKVHGDEATHLEEIRRWYKRFKKERENIYDDYNFCRTLSSTKYFSYKVNVIAPQMRQFVAANSYTTFLTLAAKLGQPTKVIHRFLPETPKMEFYNRLVPRKLTMEQRQARYDHCRDIIEMITINNNNKSNSFLDSLVVGHEMWFFKYKAIEDRSASSQPGPLNKPMYVLTDEEKIKFICFYDSRGIIHREFVSGQLVESRQYYLAVMEHLWNKICRKRPDYKRSRSWYLLLDKVPGFSSIAVRKFLAERQVCVLYLPPYSPDLSPCEYYLFDQIRSKLYTFYFANLKSSIKKCINTINQKDLSESIHGLFERVKRCCDKQSGLLGDYLKENVAFQQRVLSQYIV